MKDNEPRRGKWRHSLKTVLVAGTGMCVHIPFRLNPIASLAWLGKQLPCPLLRRKVAPFGTVVDTLRIGCTELKAVPHASLGKTT